MKLILSILFAAFAASAQVPQQVVNDWMLMAVPRGVAWSPTNISGLVRWYDAQSIVGLNNGDAVSSWTDKVGTTNFTQTEASYQPTYISSSSVFGNKPCLFFDGTDNYLTNSSVADSTITLFITAYITNVNLGAMWDFKFSAGAACKITATGSDKWRYTSTAMTNTGGTISASGVVIANFDSTSSLSIRGQDGAYTNGIPNGTYDDSGDITGLGFYTGGSYFKGFVGEILIYDSSLTDANVNIVGEYLANRWNFTWTDL